jgi:SAM-dependent methyltransferase
MSAKSEMHSGHRYVAGAWMNEDVLALRALFAPYTEAEISLRHSMPDLAGFTMAYSEDFAGMPERTPMEALVRLFHDGLSASAADLPADTLSLLDRLGLIAPDAEHPGSVNATVGILRVAGELLVCDRGGAPAGAHAPPQRDLVYPPIFANTRQYLESLPATPCDAMLEIGTGSGIAAIMGARHARHVWATDITARAVDYATLSCRLAGVDNVTVLEGDLYSPVDGLTFDRIAIHPPWMPAGLTAYVFGDGGEDGESIIRGAIEGLPRFLRPGGRFYATMLASDREGEKFEQRVRRWLGDTADSFDIALAERVHESTDVFLAQNLARGSTRESDVPSWIGLWKATRTEAMVYGHLTIERHEGERVPLTSRAPISYSA